MAPKYFLWILLFGLCLEAVHCQWGLSFGWFWGNLEDLKSSKVEAGVVKSSSYIPGSKTETNLFDDSDSSSSEEDSVAIVSSIVDQQKRRRANHRSGRRGSKRPGKGKRLRKYGRRNKNYQNSQGRIKNFRKSQQRQRQIQKLRKKYNDHIRKKYGKKALKSVGMDSKQWAQNENSTGEKYRSKSLQKEQTSYLEEIVNPSSSHQSPSKASPDHENTPSAKQSSKSNIQGIKSNTNKMSIKSSQKINVQTPATNKQEVEHENETTDAPEAEDKSTIPTTTTTEMTTQESEYEQDYFGFMDLFGFDQDVYNFPTFPEGQSTDNFNNNNNNFSPESSVGSQPAGSDKPKTGVGRGLNTQASPLKSNDVTMQELEKSPQSILSATANKTEGENFHKSGGIKMKESNLDSISTVVKEPALQARTDLQTKKGKPSGNLSLKQKSSYGTSQNKQTVSIPIEAEKRFLKNKYKLPTVSDPAKNDKSFNLHVDHPQAWKSYDIINPKPNILKPFKSNEQQQGLASVTGKTTHEQAPINMETSKNILSNRGTFHTNTNSDHQQVNNNLITGNKESRIRSNTVGKLPGSNVVETNNLNVNKNVQQYSNRKSITANNLSRVHQMGKTLDSQRIGNNLNNKENKKVQTKPGDNIVNGKNGKKINALFPSTVRKSTTWKPNFSSKIEKTWVDAFLPDKSTAKISNQQPSRDPSKNASNSPMYRGKVAPKKIDSLFSLSQTASQGKNVQLNRLDKHAVISKPIISPEIYPSGSKGRKITPSLSKPAGTVSFKENAPNTEKDNSLKKRPISTLSHMPTSVTAIPSDISKSSWDGSINDRMSYKYRNSQAKTNKMDMNLSQLTSNIESRQQVKPSFTKTLSAKNITNPPKPLNLPYPNVPDNRFKTGVNSVSKFPGKGQSQPPKPPNIISEGFPSRVKKQSSTKTDTEVDIYPDIPSQGNVHIKLPEIPTRLTKELGQREMTNSHQKSPPEPPIVLDQIEVPTNRVFSYSNSSNDENRLSPSSASIDGRLANINRPPPPAKKLQLTLLETEQKPDSKMVAPNSAGLSQSRRAQSKMIQAQNIKLIPYSNAIPMKQALKGGNKQNEMRKLSQIETKSYFGRKRYDKPTRDHGFSSMQSNMIEKQPRISIRSNLHHKSYNPDNFRINSAEMISPNLKKSTLPNNKQSHNMEWRVQKVNNTREQLNGAKRGGGRNIISEMKSRLKGNLTDFQNKDNHIAQEYQSTAVKVEKITKIPNVSLLSKQLHKQKIQYPQKQRQLKTSQNVPMSGYKKAPQKSGKYNFGSGRNNPTGRYPPSKSGIWKPIKQVNGQHRNTQTDRRMVISSGAIIKKSTLPNRKSANSLARQNMPSLGRQKPNSPPQPIVTGSPNPTTTNGENKLEQEGQLPTARNALRQAVKTTSNPSTTNSENELEQETEEQTTQLSGTTSSSNTTSVENENEAEEEQTLSSQQTLKPTQQSTTQEEGEYEYENDYATTTDGQSGGRGGRGPQGVGAAGDNIFSGSWKDAVRENAREIALEMEGTWTAINASTVGRKNTCPSYKMRYQGNAVVFDTIVGQCRVIITWNKRQQREQVKEKVSWGINTYYRSRTIYVPVVTYVDLR